MAMNFPNPQDALVYTPPGGGPQYYWRDDHWARKSLMTASPYNMIVNPAMQISQQWGDNAGSSTGIWVADQWFGTANTPVNWNRSEMQAAFGKKKCIQMVVPGAGLINININQYIEGLRIRDLKYGTTNAEWSVLRLIAQASVTGTYSVMLSNYPVALSILFPFTITQQSQPQTFSFAVPPCTTGTWLTDTSFSAKVTVVPSVTNNGMSTTGAWTANTILNGLTGQVELGAVTNGQFFLFDVGWYRDPERTGIAPDFVTPLYEEGLDDCLRYWYKSHSTRGVSNTATAAYQMSMTHPIPMRATPTLTLVGAALRVYDLAGPAVTSISAPTPTTQVILYNTANVTGLTPGRSCNIIYDNESNYIATSARPF